MLQLTSIQNFKMIQEYVENLRYSFTLYWVKQKIMPGSFCFFGNNEDRNQNKEN
jgi:hypothetical protein